MSRRKLGDRKKGTTDQVTRDIKEAYSLLIENNLNNMEIWLNKLASKDPGKAFKLIIKLSKYIIPKLSRSNFDLKATEHENKIIKVTYEDLN